VYSQMSRALQPQHVKVHHAIRQAVVQLLKHRVPMETCVQWILAIL